MAKSSKRAQAVLAKVNRTKAYPVSDALGLVKECATAKFDESIDVAVNLGIDAKKSDQLVRGSVVLPSGTGKTVRVAVFAQGEKAEAARAAGADVVGFDDLAATVKAGNINFDVVIATPDAMKVVGALGQILGAARVDAESEGRHGDHGRHHGSEKCQGGSGAVSDRQGGNHSLHHWPRLIQRRGFAEESFRADRGAAKGQAVGVQGALSEESVVVQHHGRRRSRRPGQPVGASIERLWAVASRARFGEWRGRLSKTAGVREDLMEATEHRCQAGVDGVTR